MKPVITGKITMSSRELRPDTDMTAGIRQIRITNDLELLTVVAAGRVLNDAGMDFPAGNSDLGIFIGIDDAIEDIKDEYFSNILNDGIVGASPLLFPFTSPNAFAAQASIAYDIRGESITFFMKNIYSDVIIYSVDCIEAGHIKMAVTGGISIKHDDLSAKEGRYAAEFYFIEGLNSAQKRGARIYSVQEDWLNGFFSIDR
jgi:3-oxoacyl-(acyl-carrier-protein) synthase